MCIASDISYYPYILVIINFGHYIQGYVIKYTIKWQFPSHYYLLYCINGTQLHGFRIIISYVYLKQRYRFPPVFIIMCDKT